MVQQADVFAKTSEFEHHYLSATCCPIISPRHPTRFSFALTVPQTPPPQGTSFFAALKTHVLKWKHRPPQNVPGYPSVIGVLQFLSLFYPEILSAKRKGKEGINLASVEKCARKATPQPPGYFKAYRQNTIRRDSIHPRCKQAAGRSRAICRRPDAINPRGSDAQ